jgi:hypothetical protein
MGGVGCFWADCLVNLVDLEGVALGMLSLVGSNISICCFNEVVDVSCTWCDHFNLLDLEGLLVRM